MHPCIILQIKPTRYKNFLVCLFLFSTCFGQLCAHHQEKQLYLCDTTLHTRQSSMQNNKYQVSHKYSCFSWWWAHSRPKHVENRNKHTKKNCAPSWLYLQDFCKYLYLHNFIKLLAHERENRARIRFPTSPLQHRPSPDMIFVFAHRYINCL